MISPCLLQLCAPSAIATCPTGLAPHQCICADASGCSQGSLICPRHPCQVLRDCRQVCLLLLPNSRLGSTFQVTQSHPLLGKAKDEGPTARATAGGEGGIPPKMVRGAFLRSPQRCPVARPSRLLDLMAKRLCSEERREMGSISFALSPLT